MNQQRYTIESLASALDRAPSTVRLWIKSYYAAWVPTIPGTDPTEYPPEALDVLRVVDALSKQKRRRKEIERKLAERFPTDTAQTGPQVVAATAQHQSLPSSDLVLFLGALAAQQQEIIARLERIEQAQQQRHTEPETTAADEQQQSDTDEKLTWRERVRHWWDGLF